ncbi:MAG: hypothetical protein ACUVWR_11600 [Anaerolineae bacterium]
MSRPAERRLPICLASTGVLGYFTLATIVMTWPLIAHCRTAVIGWVGDNFYFVWLVGWFEKALAQWQHLPWVVPTLNYPEGWNLAYNEMTPAMVLLALPMAVLDGPVLGYNIALLLSYGLSGFGAYLWVRRLTGNRLAGLVAGTAFAFAPYRQAHALGHLNLMGTQWLPFYFMSLHEMLSRRGDNLRPAVSAGIFLGLIAFTSQYYLYMSIVMSVVYVLSYLVLVNTRSLRRERMWRRLGVAALIALPLIAIALLPYLALARNGVWSSHSFEDVRLWSASPMDFLLPSPRHFFWGQWVQAHFDRSLWIENTLYLGIAAGVLAAIGLGKGRAILAKCGTPRLLAVVVVVAALLAMGTDLHWLGKSVTVPVPAFLQHWHPYASAFIPLPGYFLFKYLPFYSGMRVWMRYGIFAHLFLSLLAGLGGAWLIWRARHWAVPAAALLIALVLLDSYQGTQMLSSVQGRAVDYWLAGQPDDGAVAQLPIEEAVKPEHTYYTLLHGKPFIGGFFAAFTPPQFRQVQPVLRNFPDQASIDLLAALGVKYVLLDSSRYPGSPQWQESLAPLGLELATVSDGQYVYILVDR